MTEETELTKKDYLLYKLDRSVAIIGIILIAVAGILIYKGTEGVNIATTAIGGLVGYVGGRTGR